ncbi:leucine-rich repeat protein [Histomonas meleagridis]|uniref:leucine-rich repeat protein n=1 Tax=Histomonas meleagridis TaxID=135588 RepID=UPI003559745D|nr:leucine-rich repeat protein [Histomonas meleagridis]KAH0799532.1 leucine-rich repeat protein [Histomonas meleagridis]
MLFLLFNVLTSQGYIPDNFTLILNAGEIENKIYLDFKNKTKSLIFVNDVAKIPNSAFIKWASLEFVNVANSITSICDSAFSECSSLSTLIIGESVQVIEANAFSYCHSLTNVTIPDSVTSIGISSFSPCFRLQRINVSKGNSNYSNFENDGILYNKDLTLIICYPSGIPSKSFNVPSSITTICNYSFNGCRNLTNVNIGENVIQIEQYGFSDCIALTTVTFPHEGKLKTINRYAFAYCDSLSSISIPNTVEMLGSAVFFSCGQLEKVSLPSDIETINSFTFTNCYKLKDVTLGNKIQSINQYAFSNTAITNITIPNSTITIGKYSFISCLSLEDVVIGENIEKIEESAFSHCSKLKSVTIKSVKLYTIEKSAFSVCPSLATVTLDDRLSSIGETTFSKSGLKSIIIPSSLKTIPTKAFEYCTSLESVILNDGLKEIKDEAFTHCESLMEITIPKTVTSIGINPFTFCNSLQKFNVSISNMQYCTYANDGVLYWKTSLGPQKLISYPSGCRSPSFTTPEYMKGFCSYSFCNCSYLESIIIEEHVLNFEKYSILQCENLKCIYYYSLSPPNCSMRDTIFYDIATSTVMVKKDYNGTEFPSMSISKGKIVAECPPDEKIEKKSKTGLIIAIVLGSIALLVIITIIIICIHKRKGAKVDKFNTLDEPLLSIQNQ